MKILHRYTGELILEIDTLVGTNLTDSDLRHADLTGANLTDSDLRCADLICADLTGTNLTGTNLTGTNLTGANLRHADLTGANLRHADLRHANLRCANLTDADLLKTTGNGKEIKTYQFGKYTVNLTDTMLWVGCEGHNFNAWENFSNEQIKGMDLGALTWWEKHKKIVFDLIEINKGEL